MATVIAVANQKGGVGKTTTTVNLAYAIINRGKTVLAIDADPQASLTTYLGHDPDQLDEHDRTLYSAMIDGRTLASLIIDGSPALIPSGIRLASAEPGAHRKPTSKPPDCAPLPPAGSTRAV